MFDIYKIKHLAYRHKCQPSGLELKDPDPRNYRIEDLGWGRYEPKHQIKILPGISDAYDQGTSFCCQWFATTKGKEYDERERLAPSSLVSWGRINGLTGDRGLSSMEAGEKGLKNWGCLSEQELPNKNPDNYWDFSGVDVSKFNAQASIRKSKTYWETRRVEDIYKFIDEGRPVKIGIPWYSGFNRGSGREDYWLIENPIGYSVGGHSEILFGYAQNFRGRRGFFPQNSYSPQWGETFKDNDGNSVNGAGFISEDFLRKYGSRWGFFVNLDVERVSKYDPIYFEGKAVKGELRPEIYKIDKGVKRHYENWDAFIRDFPDKIFSIVPQSDLDNLSIGQSIK